MKKITLIMMLFVAFITLNAQDGTWEFTNDAQGWETNVTDVAVAELTWETSGAIKFAFVDKTHAKVQLLTGANVDADTKKAISITLANNSSIVEMQLIAKNSAVRQIIIIEANSANKTYDVNITDSDWTGNVDDIVINVTRAVVATGDIIIDKIEFIDKVPTTEKSVYEFDTDSENWIAIGGTLTGPVSGILTYTPLADNWAKIEQTAHHVVADNYNWLRLKLKNNSTGDNEIVLITSLGRASVEVTTEDVTEQIYEILLDTIGIGGTGVSTWTGNAEGITLRFGDKDTGKSTGTGSFEINSIEFYSEGTTPCVMEITSDPLTAALVDNEYSYQVSSTMCDGTFSLATDPDASSWLSIDAATGLVSGTPTAEGNVDVTITLSDGVNDDVTQEYTLVISPVSVNANATDAISIYPNPANDVLNIANANGSQLTIFDITGKRLFTQSIVSDNTPINISELQKGIYIVSLNSGTSIKNLRVIVE